MSQETLTKKRKHPASTIEAEGPTKKYKKDAKTKKVKKDKGKAKESDTEFQIIKASLVVSIPPVFAGNPRTGVEEMLDSMIMRYIPAFRGVVLAHSNLSFLDKASTIKADCPFLVCNIAFDATVWSPHVGMKLVGKVNLCSPDHIALLVHRTFNVSIPRHHIPTDEWEFEYGPAENDPEFGPGAQDEEEKSEDEGSQKPQGETGGQWVHKITSEKLGGPDGFLEFTVIGLTVANEMLSLLGSVQSDPFSPYHVPENGPPKMTVVESDDDTPMDEPVEILLDDDDTDEEDAFVHLGKRGDEAAAEEAKRKAEAAALAATEKKDKEKRKRKVEKMVTDEQDTGKAGNKSGKEKKPKKKKTS